MCLFFILGFLNWIVEEEEVVKWGVNKFGYGSWKEIKENDFVFINWFVM